MAIADDFEAWWTEFPRKVGKLAARKAYEKVRRGGISQEELVDGIASYLAAKPAYADYCHPRTFLSQGRWLDQPDTPAKGRLIVPCPHTPACLTTWACGRKQQQES